MPERSSVQVMMSRPAALASRAYCDGDDAVRRVEREQREGRRRPDVDALLLVAGQLGEARQVRHRVGIVQVDRLPAECRLVLDPVQHVVAGRTTAGRRSRGDDAGRLVLVDHLLRVRFLREAVERHRHARRLELGRHLHAELLEQLDALLVGQQVSAGRAGVEVGAEVGRAAQVLRGVSARGLNASILPRSVLNSASVMSLVRHSAVAGVMSVPVRRRAPPA